MSEYGDLIRQRRTGDREPSGNFFVRSRMLPAVQARIAAKAAAHQERANPVLVIVPPPEPEKPVDLVGRQLEALTSNWAAKTTAEAAKTANEFFGEAWKVLENEPVTAEQIKRAVAKHFHIPKSELDSQRRHKSVVLPRQIAMYLCRCLTTRSYPDIGKRFGGRDHTTVLHAERKITGLMLCDEKLRADVEELFAVLKPNENPV